MEQPGEPGLARECSGDFSAWFAALLCLLGEGWIVLCRCLVVTPQPVVLGGVEGLCLPHALCGMLVMPSSCGIVFDLGAPCWCLVLQGGADLVLLGLRARGDFCKQ